MSAELVFSVYSGGKVRFDLEICATCQTKACVSACGMANLACVITLHDGLPALRVTPAEAARGACIECLACEMACDKDGIGGIDFTLPMPELDALLEAMAAHGEIPGFAQG